MNIIFGVVAVEEMGMGNVMLIMGGAYWGPGTEDGDGDGDGDRKDTGDIHV